jgi:uncharacterized linocin/CFP29 family protein
MMADLNWADAQWQKVNDAVNEAFQKASVTSAFLPMYGPLSGAAEVVRNERLQEDDESTPPTIRLDRDHRAVNLKLVNLTANVELTSEQVADETLANAQLAFRRAANILALEQDRVVFAGYGRGFRDENSRFVMNQVDPQKGLADLYARVHFTPLGFPQPPEITLGQLVVSAVVKAMTTLEDGSNPAPFACVLGNTLFEGVHDPSSSLVLPADRVTPLLRGGPMLRSGRIDPNSGIVVSLAGNTIDIVVGTPPTVQFLQRTPDAKFLFRVYLRFALRFRESDGKKSPVAGFRLLPDTDRLNEEQEQLKKLKNR